MENQITEVRHATSSASPMVVQNDDVVTPERPRYVPPSRGIHDDWDGCKLESYTPTERQKSVIEAVKSALESKQFYTDEVLKYCIDYLGVTPEQSKVAKYAHPLEKVKRADFPSEEGNSRSKKLDPL